MTILVCGSLAYDTIMVFPDQFKKHILADQIHILNVAFMVPDMRRDRADMRQVPDHVADAGQRLHDGDVRPGSAGGGGMLHRAVACRTGGAAVKAVPAWSRRSIPRLEPLGGPG